MSQDQQNAASKNISITPVPALEYVRAWGVPITVLSTLSTMVVGLADFLSPKLQLLPPLTLLGIASIGAALVAKRKFAGSPESRLTKWLGVDQKFYAAPAFNMAVVATLILFVGTQVSTANAAKHGYLAANSPKIASLQQAMGVLSNIEQTTVRTEVKVDEANRKLDEIKGIVASETELSDPRKELARLQISWTAAAFGDAIRRNDEKVVRLFLKGGMPAHLGDSTAPPPMANVMLLSGPDRAGMLRLLATSSVPLGTSWRVKSYGYPEDTCLATTCFGMDMKTCANAFPRVEMWRQFVELGVTLDNTCKEVLGGSLAELEAAHDADDGRQQIMRQWGVQNTQHDEQAEHDPSRLTPRIEIYAAYRRWASDNGFTAFSSTKFWMHLRRILGSEVLPTPAQQQWIDSRAVRVVQIRLNDARR